jgi:hypothetical protein
MFILFGIGAVLAFDIFEVVVEGLEVDLVLPK